MTEFYRTLEFKDQTDDKYAHSDPSGWYSSSMPMLMTDITTIEYLQKMYPHLDFDCVNLVRKAFLDVEI